MENMPQEGGLTAEQTQEEGADDAKIEHCARENAQKHEQPELAPAWIDRKEQQTDERSKAEEQIQRRGVELPAPPQGAQQIVKDGEHCAQRRGEGKL